MQKHYSEENILKKALANGDKEAFKFLMKAYFQKLCAYAFSLCHNKLQSEDIVQNVIIKLWRKKENIKDVNRLSSFLYRSVYNECIDQYRQNKEVIALEKRHIEQLSSFVEDDDEDLDRLIKLVSEEIEQLPKKCKQTFLLSKKEGLTNFEIADYLNISIKSVEAHMTNAYRIIRKKLRDN